MADISLAGLGSEHRSQIMLFLSSLKKKSDTAVALRRGISIFPCLTIVFIDIYNEYFCKMMWLSAISLDVFGTSERNAPKYTEILLYKYELYQTKHTCIV